MPATLARSTLPRLLLAACDEGGPLAKPWRHGTYVCATDGRMLAMCPIDRLADDDVADLRDGLRSQNLPNVRQLMARWKPDGGSLMLPLGLTVAIPCPWCQGDPDRMPTCPNCYTEGTVLNRSRVELRPGIALFGYRVAMLTAHGVREVYTGAVGPRDLAAPVRFETDDVEGVLLPLRPRVRG